FYSYEGRRDASKESVTNIVPYSNVGQGIVNFHSCTVLPDPDDPTSTICPKGALTSVNAAQLTTIFPDIGGLNPAALQALSAASASYPANDTSLGDLLNTGAIRFNASTPVSLNSNVLKLDANLTNHQTVFVRGNIIYDHYTGTPRYPESTPTSEWDHPTGIA